ncbi:Do family serine endopeptidase [Porphyromonas sp.]|uniref:Do family serine endopeptidase n=1 Tax=Porphyromonas sp. TaxID=1924944 RepID=UPI0026DC0E9C|nr:Do family serine endopeptidase [Porphyromonas sp.]MDO4770859.1 Do family serine endopeptidase [Porphyromonas sp.]
MKRGIKTVTALLCCSTLSAVGAVGLYDYYQSHKTHSIVQDTPQGEFRTVRASMPVAFGADHAPQDFVDVAESSINGVVNIRAEVMLSEREMSRRYMDPFEFFFGPFNRGNQPRQDQKRPSQIGIGSGVIISTDGYIITNNHVIDNATKIIVTTNDNKEWEAKVIGSDPATDIALIKIEAKDLAPLPIGDSEKVKVGEWVLAIGNPFNLSSTVTAGIVSAKGRSTIAKGELQIASFIQTDAAVNPGNSGGALVNTKGELIGINTMIYSNTGNYAGYSFAVPMSIASKVVADIKKYGAVQRAVLGIVGSNIVSDLTQKYDLKVSEGAVVINFADYSPAKTAGILEGDVITRINKVAVRNMAEVQEQISKYRPGDKITVTVDRKGKTQDISLTLKNMQGTTEVVNGLSASSLGAAFKPLTEEQRKKFGINHGVSVVGVDNGKLKDAGISKGFIILSINNVKVNTAEDVEAIVKEVIANSPDKALFIKGAYPNGKIKYFAVDLS